MIDLVMRFFAVVLFALNTPPPRRIWIPKRQKYQKVKKKGKEAKEVMVDQE